MSSYHSITKPSPKCLLQCLLGCFLLTIHWISYNAQYTRSSTSWTDFFHSLTCSCQSLFQFSTGCLPNETTFLYAKTVTVSCTRSILQTRVMSQMFNAWRPAILKRPLAKLKEIQKWSVPNLGGGSEIILKKYFLEKKTLAYLLEHESIRI